MEIDSVIGTGTCVKIGSGGVGAMTTLLLHSVMKEELTPINK